MSAEDRMVARWRHGYGSHLCDAYHSGLEPPPATVDFGRRVHATGIPGMVRYLCDPHARGLTGWRDRYRMDGAPEPEVAR